MAKKRKTSIRKGKDQTSTTIYLPRELHLKARVYALQENLSFTKLVEKLIEEYVKEKERER